MRSSLACTQKFLFVAVLSAARNTGVYTRRLYPVMLFYRPVLSLVSTRIQLPITCSRLSILARSSASFSLQITNRSFRYASPHLWNQLPSSFCQPHSVSVHCPPDSLILRLVGLSPHHSPQSPPSLSPSVTPSA